MDKLFIGIVCFLLQFAVGGCYIIYRDRPFYFYLLAINNLCI